MIITRRHRTTPRQKTKQHTCTRTRKRRTRTHTHTHTCTRARTCTRTRTRTCTRTRTRTRTRTCGVERHIPRPLAPAVHMKCHIVLSAYEEWLVLSCVKAVRINCRFVLCRGSEHQLYHINCVKALRINSRFVLYMYSTLTHVRIFPQPESNILSNQRKSLIRMCLRRHWNDCGQWTCIVKGWSVYHEACIVKLASWKPDANITKAPALEGIDFVKLSPCRVRKNKRKQTSWRGEGWCTKAV